MSRALALIEQQAEDDGLWFQAETAAEAYLQHELRNLHEAVEEDAALESEKTAFGGGLDADD